jgi:hypothetical protein
VPVLGQRIRRSRARHGRRDTPRQAQPSQCTRVLRPAVSRSRELATKAGGPGERTKTCRQPPAQSGRCVLEYVLAVSGAVCDLKKSGVVTTGEVKFPECQKSGTRGSHSSPSVALGEERFSRVPKRERHSEKLGTRGRPSPLSATLGSPVDGDWLCAPPARARHSGLPAVSYRNP